MASSDSDKNEQELRKMAQKFEKEETRFFDAIKQNDCTMVDAMLARDKFRDYMEQSDKLLLAFLQVVLLNSVPLLDLFVKHGVDVKASDCMFFENGIMHSTRYGHKEMLEQLILYGVDINHQRKNGSTALHIAISNMKLGCLEILTRQKGIDLNIQDHTGYSPLLCAAKLRDWKAMGILIDAGCNVQTKDFNKGATALHVVVNSREAFSKSKATNEDTLKCMNLLLDAGLDINALDSSGNLPLWYAIKSNNMVAVTALLKFNCRFTPLHSANLPVYFHFNDNVTGIDKDLLPLYRAMSRLQMKCVKMLCLAGIRYHRLAVEPTVLDYIGEFYPPMAELLQGLLTTPLSLKQASRSVIREAMTADIRSITEDDLNLPVSLLKYIMLDDLDEL